MNNIIQTIRHTARAAAMLLIALLTAQTAGAQMPEPKPCKITFDISSGGTVEFRGETVTNSQTIDFHIPSDEVLTITPETGYVVSSVTYDAPDWLSIGLKQKDDFHWSLNIPPYGGSDTPTITVHIVFDKGLAGGADEASAVALTADDDLSHLTGGWYKVESDLTFGHTVNLHGDTHITIATGATLTVSTSDEYGISGTALTVSGEGTLAVSASNRAIYVDNYTQTGCAVTLSGSSYGLHAKNNVSISGGSLTTSGADYGIGSNEGAITISGGTVSSSGKQCGLYATKAMNITGGTVNASGNVGNGIRGYSVSITGGQVTVSSGGIMSNYGDITLGCTSATDYITASGYVLQNDGFYVKIADGQTLYGGGFPSASYTGTIVDPSALNGLMLRPTAAVTKSGTNEYTIWNAAGWDAFCDRLANSDKGFFTGKTVKLGADITVTGMAGVSQHDFTGTFDGQGHTLTVDYNATEDYAAPFRNAENGCVVENLHVAGTIATSAQYAAGIISNQFGNVIIRNCRVSVTISSSKSGDGTHGGLVAVKGNSNSAHLTIEGCVFDGKIVSTGTGDDATTNCGGFVGWRKDSGSLTITNCLYAPTADDNAVTVGATFARNGGTITNCYYTRTLGDAQGKALHSVTAGDDVTLALSGTATEYTVSGITAYEGNQGIKYGTTYYAGSNDVVSLTLSNTATGAPEGYSYGYTVSAGTLSGSTLTMPAEDVTVSLALRSTGELVPVSYVDADGNTVSDQTAIALDGTETDLGEGWYFVGLPTVAFDHTLYLHGNVHLILADGCTMNVTSNDYGIDVNGSLTIYGQTDGTGALNATSEYNAGIFTDSGTITISGGRVTATGGNGIYTSSGNLTISGGRVTATSENGTGIYTNSGYITISGGRVTATSENGTGISTNSGTITISGGIVTATGFVGIFTESGTITISGGRVTATGALEGIYIYNSSGNLTLGCTTASDFIYASSYSVESGGTLNIADGPLFDEDGNYYWGYDVTIPAGKTLRLYPGIALTARQAPDGNYWTTYYNSARGFTIDADVNACAYTATYGDGKLTLHNQGKQIPAGTAVIIVADNDVVSMTATTALDDFSGTNDLRGVDVDTQTSALGTGTFYVLGMTTVDGEQHFGFHRYTGSTMAAHKAFVLVSGSQALARSLTMVFDEATGIESAEANSSLFTLHSSLSSWFTLDGRRLQAKPTAPGIYVNNGKKVVIK